MIPKKKLYLYNRQTLKHEIKNVSFRLALRSFLRFVGMSSVLAIVFSAVFTIIWGSPVNRLLEYNLSSVKENFFILNNRIDSLQVELHSRHYPIDSYYREILELDSIPLSVRLAGTGGSQSTINIEGNEYRKLINTTSRRLVSVKKQLKVQNESYNTILKEALIFNSELSAIPAIQPVKPSDDIWISSYYGYRKDPFTKRRKMHKGIDYCGAQNTEIFATADGLVSKIKNSRRGYGKEIVILHKFGYSTRYAHLNDILVKEGDNINRGQLIGLMGNTGRSTGTHLHYEVRKNKRTVNPVYFYTDDLSTREYEMITEQSHNEN